VLLMEVSGIALGLFVFIGAQVDQFAMWLFHSMEVSLLMINANESIPWPTPVSMASPYVYWSTTQVLRYKCGTHSQWHVCQYVDTLSSDIIAQPRPLSSIATEAVV
jgi:hypothetical protein